MEEMICQKAKSEWKTERVREDSSGDSKDGEEDDDELPCVIGESEGESIWRGTRRSVGSSFHRQGAAYRKARLVIFKEDWIGGRARVTRDEERMLWQVEQKSSCGDIEVGLLWEPYMLEKGIYI